MSNKIPKRITIHDPDKGTTKNYEVMGTTESGSRGSELKYGKDGLVYGVCHHPPERCYKAHTSGRSYYYHWE